MCGLRSNLWEVTGLSTPLSLKGQVVLITGAGGGIGRAHAELLASRGASVVVNDVGSTVDGSGGSVQVAESCAESIRAAGGEAVASSASIATREGGEEVVAIAVEKFGRIDAVIHNAGILRDRSFAKLSEQDIEDVFAVHLHGGFNVCQPAFQIMKEQRYGRIVLTTSSSGLLGTFGQANYAAAKMGLVGLMNVIAVEGERFGITANCIGPTARTRMTEELLGDMATKLDPAHVAAFVAYLVSPECDLSHHIFSVGGGRIARVFIGMTPGWSTSPRIATPEEIRDHIQEIVNIDDFIVPKDGTDEIALIQSALGA